MVVVVIRPVVAIAVVVIVVVFLHVFFADICLLLGTYSTDTTLWRGCVNHACFTCCNAIEGFKAQGCGQVFSNWAPIRQQVKSGWLS